MVYDGQYWPSRDGSVVSDGDDGDFGAKGSDWYGSAFGNGGGVGGGDRDGNGGGSDIDGGAIGSDSGGDGKGGTSDGDGSGSGGNGGGVGEGGDEVVRLFCQAQSLEGVSFKRQWRLTFHQGGQIFTI